MRRTEGAAGRVLLGRDKRCPWRPSVLQVWRWWQPAALLLNLGQ